MEIAVEQKNGGDGVDLKCSGGVHRLVLWKGLSQLRIVREEL